MSSLVTGRIPETTPATTAATGSTASWVITLFGTAVGAGILFLPLDAGAYGFWPLLIVTLLAGPLAFFSHVMYARIVSIAPVRGRNVLSVTSHVLGARRGLFVALIYWLGIYPTVLIYGISITNTVDSFLVNQLGLALMPRWLLAILCVGVLTLAFSFGQRLVLAIAQVLVYPLILTLGGVSFYLIPQWDVASFASVDGGGGWATVLAVLVLLPVLVFSFSHMAAVSQFALDVQGNGRGSGKQATRIELYTVILLVVFTMFFVWSCVLAIGPDGLAEARAQNLPVLSYFANTTGSTFMAWMAPVVSILAISSSFFGHMLGAEEGSRYLLSISFPNLASRWSLRTQDIAVYVFVFVTATVLAIANPSIMDLISVVGGVFMGSILFLLPLWVYRNNPAYQRLARQPISYVVFVFGVVILGMTVVKMFL